MYSQNCADRVPHDCLSAHAPTDPIPDKNLNTQQAVCSKAILVAILKLCGDATVRQSNRIWTQNQCNRENTGVSQKFWQRSRFCVLGR